MSINLTTPRRPKRCQFCGAPLNDEAELTSDPQEGGLKWVCADSDACAERGRKG